MTTQLIDKNIDNTRRGKIASTWHDTPSRVHDELNPDTAVKHHLVRSLPALLFLVAYQVAVRAQNPPEWNKGAEQVLLQWKERAASPLDSFNHLGDKYSARLLSKKGEDRRLHISVLEDEREVFTFTGHSRTVFRIVGDRLYYGLFSPYANGAKIVAVDLQTGKELWKSALMGIGPQEHSAYSNALNLEADNATVRVFGNESNGQYFESKRANTGVTTAHKIFSRDETDSSAIAVRNAVKYYHDACQRGDLETTKRLLESGLDVQARYWGQMVDKPRETALHLAAEKGAPAVIAYLLDQGHPVDLRDPNDMTPLLIAIQLAQKSKAAAQGDAKPRVLFETGLTELQGALKSCQILLQRGAALPEPWLTRLRDVAQASGDLELVRMLKQTSATKPSPSPTPPQTLNASNESSKERGSPKPLQQRKYLGDLMLTPPSTLRRPAAD